MSSMLHWKVVMKFVKKLKKPLMMIENSRDKDSFSLYLQEKEPN